jgi:predicted phage baseplate assembly protein
VEQGQRDHTYTIQISDEGKPMLTFGNGQSGARLPTGVENIRAVYRSGIGSRGNVREGQLSLLISRPLGVKEVINPLRASGGADPESRDTARKNIPLAVMALDRLVSVPDYAAFARTFAGIAKASAIKLSDGRRQVVHVTIAGLDDIPIDPISDLFLALRRALLSSGDPHLAVRVDRRELILLVLSAGVSLLPGYQWEVVQPKIIAALLENFSFNVRELGQTVHLSEVIAVMQTVLGVAYIDVDVFNGLPEQVRDANGILKPITPDQIKELATKREERIVANLASVNQGVFSPAQIACFPVDVSATITLNLIEEKK